ncbi:MAG TPA: L-serine ammonia-lyase, iron-sulfur-dependent subunit beta [Holophaga sp.]|nr:L-serine ammonia-lyase, iron-sulfur-dependent subunit beta [Holophaga sp.]HPS66464.1 L-serine ammonia-lyase, iron-sulfur-dependent subunit beta [Holophaga sp.]
MGIFDIIGPVMVGPSSSHTAGAVRIGLMARRLLGSVPAKARIALHGSMAATGRGHGTPLALLAGILGFGPDDERIPVADRWALEEGLEYRFEEEDLGDVHPNSVRIHLATPDHEVDVCGSSIGGARIKIWDIDGFKTNLDGEFPTLLLAYPDRAGSVAVVSAILARAGLNIASMKVHRTSRGGQALMSVQLDELPPDGVLDSLRHLPNFQQIRFIPALGFGG